MNPPSKPEELPTLDGSAQCRPEYVVLIQQTPCPNTNTLNRPGLAGNHNRIIAVFIVMLCGYILPSREHLA